MISKIALTLAAFSSGVLSTPVEADVSARHVDIATLYGIDVTNKTVVDLRTDAEKQKRQNPGNIWACDNIGFVEPCAPYFLSNNQWFNVEGLYLNNRISSIGADYGAICWAWDHWDPNGCWNENGMPALDITYPGLRDLTSINWSDRIGCIKCQFWGT
ncbi:hypothetical protein Micbo1qcDRAFT_124765 [Microdochium bolleyi]|uniref:Uncharacterized protein n=1 Tax=Microdochium bolleyi TaxID=196109 RepID=A0A136IQL0_9PEZI|nr:hypothetical protein Micbo1qcDRAFT_124765 [Microdochium bolleyi]